MRLSISNIAWNVDQDEDVAILLRQFNVNAIDVAPNKYFPEPSSTEKSEIDRVRDWWKQRGIDVIGMQSLLFGTVGFNMFAAKDIQEKMLSHLRDVCRIGSILGASRLVFGSPKNRDSSTVPKESVRELACSFFRRLGDIANENGVSICLEPNPKRYGSNFMENSLDTAAVVVDVAHPAIKMQFDSGAMAINGESPAEIIEKVAPLIGHIHASEPDLNTFGEGGVDHRLVGMELNRWRPDLGVCVEMLSPKAGDNLSAIGKALVLATSCYRDVRSMNIQ
jgi:D-psicose/D-tagatose/L-ribulose 3-epimerase